MASRNPATRFVMWCAFATGLCDDSGAPSAPKIGAAIVIGAAVVVAVISREFSSGTSFVITIAIAALFGRSIFLHALNRGTFGFSRNDSQANTRSTSVNVDLNELAKTVMARRDPERGLEVSGQVPVVHHD